MDASCLGLPCVRARPVAMLCGAHQDRGAVLWGRLSSKQHCLLGWRQVQGSSSLLVRIVSPGHHSTIAW